MLKKRFLNHFCLLGAGCFPCWVLAVLSRYHSHSPRLRALGARHWILLPCQIQLILASPIKMVEHVSLRNMFRVASFCASGLVFSMLMVLANFSG